MGDQEYSPKSKLMLKVMSLKVVPEIAINNLKREGIPDEMIAKFIAEYVEPMLNESERLKRKYGKGLYLDPRGKWTL